VTTADPIETGKRNRHPTSTSPTGHKSNRPGDSHGRRRPGTARAWPTAERPLPRQILIDTDW